MKSDNKGGMSKLHITVIEYVDLNFKNSNIYSNMNVISIRSVKKHKEVQFWGKVSGCYESKIVCNIISNSSLKRIL